MVRLTSKEEEILGYFWTKGPLFVRELLDLQEEPRPHYNTLSTIVRSLEEKGYIGYEVYGNFSGDAAHPATIWRDAWTPDNHDASMPRIFYDTNSASSSRSVQSDFWLQDTSYLRLKNLQLGYTLPKGCLNSVGVENIRIYYSVENLLTFDKMKINIDPESTSQRLSSYPVLRTPAFGVNVTF